MQFNGDTNTYSITKNSGLIIKKINNTDTCTLQKNVNANTRKIAILNLQQNIFCF